MANDRPPATDKQAGMDIRTLQTALQRIAEERAGDPLQAPKNLALALAADAGILLSLFRGLAEHQNLQDDLAREAAADALTSIVVGVAQLANHIGMDASAALRARIKGRPAPPLAPVVPLVPPAPPAAPVAAPGPAAPDAANASSSSAAAPSGAAAEPVASSPAAEPVPPKAPASPAPEPATRPAKAADRKKGAPEVIAVKVAAVAPPAPVPASGSAVEVIVLDDEPAAAESTPVEPAVAVGIAGSAASAPEPDKVAPQAPPAPEPDHAIDPERVLDMAKALAKRLDGSTRDDPVLRDLRDELETLRRSLYASSTKKAWIAGSLRSLRGHLEDALSHAFAEDVRAAEFIGRIDALLAG